MSSFIFEWGMFELDDLSQAEIGVGFGTNFIHDSSRLAWHTMTRALTAIAIRYQPSLAAILPVSLILPCSISTSHDRRRSPQSQGHGPGPRSGVKSVGSGVGGSKAALAHPEWVCGADERSGENSPAGSTLLKRCRLNFGEKHNFALRRLCPHHHVNATPIAMA